LRSKDLREKEEEIGEERGRERQGERDRKRVGRKRGIHIVLERGRKTWKERN
jgi:hypothetical protein